MADRPHSSERGFLLSPSRRSRTQSTSSAVPKPGNALDTSADRHQRKRAQSQQLHYHFQRPQIQQEEPLPTLDVAEGSQSNYPRLSTTQPTSTEFSAEASSTQFDPPTMAVIAAYKRPMAFSSSLGSPFERSGSPLSMPLPSLRALTPTGHARHHFQSGRTSNNTPSLSAVLDTSPNLSGSYSGKPPHFSFQETRFSSPSGSLSSNDGQAGLALPHYEQSSKPMWQPPSNYAQLRISPVAGYEALSIPSQSSSPPPPQTNTSPPLHFQPPQPYPNLGGIHPYSSVKQEGRMELSSRPSSSNYLTGLKADEGPGQLPAVSTIVSGVSDHQFASGAFLTPHERIVGRASSGRDLSPSHMLPSISAQMTSCSQPAPSLTSSGWKSYPSPVIVATSEKPSPRNASLPVEHSGVHLASVPALSAHMTSGYPYLSSSVAASISAQAITGRRDISSTAPPAAQQVMMLPQPLGSLVGGSGSPPRGLPLPLPSPSAVLSLRRAGSLPQYHVVGHSATRNAAGSKSDSDLPPPLKKARASKLSPTQAASPTRQHNPYKRTRGLCSIQGCQKMVRSRGLCKAHGGGRRCQFPGCQVSDQGGGFCIAHGGGKRCTADGCKNAAQSRGFCKSHGGGRRCQVPGCTKSSQGGGKCRAHGGGKRCKHPSCDKGEQRGGYCAAHGDRIHCGFKGCRRAERVDGWCMKHANPENRVEGMAGSASSGSSASDDSDA